MRRTARTQIGEIREVLGIYRAELRNVGVMLQVYDNQSKAAFLEKLTLSPLFAIPTYLTMVLGREFAVSTKTCWGDSMQVVVPESGSISIATTGILEPELTKWMLTNLRRGMIVIDIGAHFGYYTLLSSTQVGQSGQVHAFEPAPSTFLVLKRNTRLRKNIYLNQTAAFSANGSMNLLDYGRRFSGFNTLVRPRMSRLVRPSRVSVPTLRIDDYVRLRDFDPDFVKIDAESSEWDIIVGMDEVIDRCHPTISIEVGDFVQDATRRSRDIIKHLLGKGYNAFDLGTGTVRKHVLRNSYDYGNILLMAS